MNSATHRPASSDSVRRAVHGTVGPLVGDCRDYHLGYCRPKFPRMCRRMFFLTCERQRVPGTPAQESRSTDARRAAREGSPAALSLPIANAGREHSKMASTGGNDGLQD